jgi:hypothetical protein
MSVAEAVKGIDMDLDTTDPGIDPLELRVINPWGYGTVPDDDDDDVYLKFYNERCYEIYSLHEEGRPANMA